MLVIGTPNSYASALKHVYRNHKLYAPSGLRNHVWATKICLSQLKMYRIG